MTTKLTKFLVVPRQARSLVLAFQSQCGFCDGASSHCSSGTLQATLSTVGSESRWTSPAQHLWLRLCQCQFLPRSPTLTLPLFVSGRSRDNLNNHHDRRATNSLLFSPSPPFLPPLPLHRHKTHIWYSVSLRTVPNTLLPSSSFAPFLFLSLLHPW